ncbi:transketolase [Bacteroidia bacterium]|nr:transketolase [Bacteroidia bacterium]
MNTNDRIVLLVADSGTGKYSDIVQQYPDRVIDFGIAECNMVAAAAGFAKEGWIPVVYANNSFLVYRAYEFIRNDVCFQNLNVKFVGLAAGVIANTLGPTHHTLEDIAALRVLPNLTLLSPASPKEVSVVLEKAIEFDGPVYIRLGKAFEREIYETESPFEIGENTIISQGNDLTIIATGSIITDAIEAAKDLKMGGITSEIINVSTLKPFSSKEIIESAIKTGKVITIEEHSIIGGLGGAVSEVLCEAGISVVFERMGFKDVFCNDYGWHQDLKRMYGLSPQHIFDTCKKVYSKRK